MDISTVLKAALGNVGRFLGSVSFRKGERGPLSWSFVMTLAFTLAYGLIMLFSSSYSIGYYRFNGDVFHFIAPQVRFAIAGVAAMFAISFINYRSLRYLNWYLYAITFGLLILALFSEEQNGCHRWVYIFGDSGSLQPSELAKFSIILGIACYADDHHEQRSTLIHGLIGPLLPLIPVLVLLYLEPHNSAIILICAIAATMMFAGGCGLRWMPLAGAAAIAGGWIMLTRQDNYVSQRLGAWGVTSSESTKNMLYQTKQSLYSIASGGLRGLGISNSRQKHLWLPEASNDFIFSVLCEELGFIGAVLCITLFVALILQAIIIALRAPDYFGSMLGIGITAQVAWQTFCHIGVVTATLPNTGISLPFFSYGGTSLLMLLGEMGVLLSISRAGNARAAANQKRQQEQFARQLNATDGRQMYRRGNSYV